MSKKESNEMPKGLVRPPPPPPPPPPKRYIHEGVGYGYICTSCGCKRQEWPKTKGCKC